jgi:thioredoxin
MKSILCLAALSLSLWAEEPVQTISNEDAKKVFEASFVKTDWIDGIIGNFANIIVTAQPTSLSKEEMMTLMKEEFFKQEQAHIDLIKAKIKPEDLSSILELLNDANFIAHRSSLDDLNNCLSCIYMKAMEAIAAHPAEIAPAVESLFPIKELGVSDFESSIAESKYVVLDVYADWCGPCKMLSPKLQTLNDELHESYTFLKLNANESTAELATSLNIKAFPTLIFYKDGKEVARKTGNLDIEVLKNFIQTTFSQ